MLRTMVKSTTTLTLLFALVSCAKPGEKPKEIKPLDISDVRSKLARYVELTKATRDSNGFIAGCDSLLFSSLSFVGGVDVDVGAAEDRDEKDRGTGKWFRRPSKDCYLSGNSASEISRDMLVGLYWAFLYTSDTGPITRHIRYGKERDWRVGAGPISRTYVTPSLRKFLGEIAQARDIDDQGLARNVLIWPSGLDGYEAHLQLLQILGLQRTWGGITESMLERINEHYKRNPENGLFSYAFHLFEDGDMASPIFLVDKYCPETLPTGADRCEEYLWEREYSAKNYEACPEDDEEFEEVYSGTDCIFLMKLILEGFDEEVGTDIWEDDRYVGTGKTKSLQRSGSILP